MQPSGTADRRWRGSSSLWISIKPAFFTFLSEPLRHGFAVTAFYAVASAGAGRSPPEISTPFRGERVPVGGGLQWRTQLSLQTLLNVPHWGTATALTRSRLSTRSLLDVCHRHTATEPTGETAGANRSQLSLRSLLGVPHRGTATEPTGEKAKGVC